MSKTGVYLCQCGGNISNTIDLDKVSAYIKEKYGEGTEVKIFSHTCSGAGQKLIKDDIESLGLDRIVVAACSPQFHEKTFKAAMEKGGLNAHVLEIANFREHISWTHKDNPEAATEKAKDIISASIAKVKLNEPLNPKTMKLGDRVLVIGGGIAGIQTSLDLADAGKKVTLVEKLPTIGGKMAVLTKTFPTEDCSACIISPKMSDVQDHPNIKLYTNSEIDNIQGHRLHFKATIRKKPRYITDTINMDQCLSCEKCVQACPVTTRNYWEQGVIDRKAVYIPAALAIPFRYIVDPETCLNFKGETCTKCIDICPQKVIDLTQKEEIVDEVFDTIVVATGYDIYNAAEKTVFGYGRYQNVVSGLEMERIVDHISEEVPPRDVGHRVAFIQCVGSRDEQIGREYCSRVCCMYSVKLASLLKQAKPDTDIYIFYTDLRAFGKGFEEYYKKAQKMGVKFVRGKPSHFTENTATKQVTVTVEDTLTRQIIESDFDLVVLANGMELSKSTDKIANYLKLAKSEDGFLKEAHPKYKPVDTLIEGVFIAGAAQGPKDIPDTVTQASAAAARVIVTLAQKEFKIDPILAFVHQDICDGCKSCISKCPKNAITMNSVGKAEVVEALCLGCGSCLESCPVEALDLHAYTNEQVYAQIDVIFRNRKENEKRILVFADNNCTYRVADALGVRKMKYTADVRIIRMPTSGRVTSKLMLYAFKKGADAIMVGDCEKENLRVEWTSVTAKNNIKITEEKLKGSGVKGQRIYFEEFNAGALAKFVNNVTAIAESLKTADPISTEIREKLCLRK
ncbi:MAG: hydrogenase iron-sulfur subunit [Candidatus Delongbacteria bacterium]|nr:hydrogenase iron-sulfur subunit [Candidatus Delongbacteria bacterium]MCG2760818.1 hydrogenase iron-sulfur subunit [Candidatus Delongbacteria bacterium]